MGEVCRVEKKISDAYFYGSYAKGDYNEKSDVDIPLTADVESEDLSPYRKALSHVRGQLSLRHDALISVNAEPLRRFRRYANALPYCRNVIREGFVTLSDAEKRKIAENGFAEQRFPLSGFFYGFPENLGGFSLQCHSLRSCEKIIRADRTNRLKSPPKGEMSPQGDKGGA